MLREVSNDTICQQATTCLKRSQLVDYYNKLVIQLRIAETLVNTSVSREIQENWRTRVEKRQRKVIELLRENILPLMDVVVVSNYNYSLAIYVANWVNMHIAMVWPADCFS